MKQIQTLQAGQSGIFDQPNVGAINTNLTVGSRGVEVVALQNFLVGEGFLTIPNGLAKGYFGQLTKSAVIRYQAASGLSEKDGYVGPLTRSKINAELDGIDGGGDTTTSPYLKFNGVTYNSLSGQLTIGWKYSGISSTRGVLISLTNGDRPNPVYVNLNNLSGKTIGINEQSFTLNLKSFNETRSLPNEEYKIRLECDGRGSICEVDGYQIANVYLSGLGGNNQTGDLFITNVAGKAAGNFEIDLNSQAYVAVNGIGTDPSAVKVYVGGIESTVIQASGNYIYFKTPITGLTVGSAYDLYLVKGNKRSNTVKVKVISKVTVYVDNSSTTPILRIEADRNIYNRNVIILPGKEESLFAVGYDITGSVYANSLEVRFERTSGSDGFFEYADGISLVDRFNRPISFEGSISYDGNATIYKFNKLAYRINNSEDFYVKVKAKTNLDKSAKFTMKVPQNGLRVGDSSYASGTIVNTITFDPTYTLQKAQTTSTQSYVKVISPNTGGTFSKGDTMEIRYETNLNTTNSEGVALQLYKTTKIAGQAWIPVLTIATKLKEGKYIWSIPTNLEEGEYNIYAVGQGVFAEGVSIGDYSDAPVTIK
jgi:peptidoglycan hydrolase-like protein with peptidoglycan-binding domain